MVVNNSKVATDEIVQSSGLAVADNMLKSFGSTVKEKIKTKGCCKIKRYSDLSVRIKEIQQIVQQI